MIDGLPPLGAVPAGADRTTYRAALGFEQILLGELVQAMVPDGALADGPYAAPAQEALTSALVAAGGVGLAAQLYPQLHGQPPKEAT
jgi:hypothetical protein